MATTVTIHDEATREVAIMALWRELATCFDCVDTQMQDAAFDASDPWMNPAGTRRVAEDAFGNLEALRDAIRQVGLVPIGSELPEPNLVRNGLEWVLAMISDAGAKLMAASPEERRRMMAIYDAGAALLGQLSPAEAVA